MTQLETRPRSSRRPRRWSTVASMAVTAGLLAVPPAWGHSGSNLTVPVLEAVTPALPEGVTVELVATQVATLMEVTNPTDEVLEVAQRDGTPWLRVSAAGVEVASGAIDTYASTSPTGGAVPQDVLAGERATSWVRVTAEPTWAWFEHRLHPEGFVPPGGDEPQGEGPVRLLEWTVPLRYGDTDVAVTGSLQLQPVTGTVEAELLGDVPAGVDVQVVAGGIPGILLTPTDAEVVEVLGVAGEVYLRFAGGTVEVDSSSPTHRAVEAARGNALPALAGPAEPTFELATGGGTYLWLETRAQPPAAIPAEVRTGGAVVELVRWEVPLVVDGELSVLEGVTRWVPLEEGAATAGPGSDDAAEAGGRVLPLLLAAVGGALLLGVVVRRRATG